LQNAEVATVTGGKPLYFHLNLSLTMTKFYIGKVELGCEC
jgi:hypothetical protein